MINDYVNDDTWLYLQEKKLKFPIRIANQYVL